MKRYGKISKVLVLILLMASCTYYVNEPPPYPEETPTLVAEHVTESPMSLKSSYWSTADYLIVKVQNITTKKVSPEDGLLNVNGMYNGVDDFNGGKSAELVLKAAYDNENLYILASWKDKTLNVSGNNWYYNGPSDPRKNDSNDGWTSQGSSDALVLTFSRGGNKADVWKWSVALSDPMGYAIDMTDNGAGWVMDAGEPMFIRNVSGSNAYRSGPQYIYNGADQQVKRSPAEDTNLDIAYYLLKKEKFTEDIVNGESLYQGHCSFCHRANGQGHGPFDTTAVSLRNPRNYFPYDISTYETRLSADSTHNGAKWWNQLTDQEKKDVFARIKSFTGIPGYYLQNPGGSASDVEAVSDVKSNRIDTERDNSGYNVLLIRKLKTGNNDDIQFDPAQTQQYEFNVYLTDDDNLNLIGKKSEKLTFK